MRFYCGGLIVLRADILRNRERSFIEDELNKLKLKGERFSSFERA